MFFVFSKLFWFVFAPLNLLIILAGLALLLLLAGWQRAGRRLLAAVMLIFVIAGFTPLADMLLGALERRYRVAETPVQAPVGIIVLGGGISAAPEKRGGYELGSSGDRILKGFELKQRFPQARLIFSGGWAGVIRDGSPEAEGAAALARALYGNDDFLELDTAARNTWENAVNVRMLIEQGGGQADGAGWMLVTSAWHMERAMGAFRAAGLNPLPVPVDFMANPADPPYVTTRAGDQFAKLDTAMKELIGIMAYRLTGRYQSRPGDGG